MEQKIENSNDASDIISHWNNINNVFARNKQFE